MPRSARALVKKRAYIRCRMACSTPPMYWSTGIQCSAAARIERRRRSFHGSQKRRKYHDESTKVSMVSVSRVGGTAAHRAGRVQEAVVVAQRRLPGRAELDVVGRQHRQLVLGHGHGAVLGAVDDRDRAAPEALPGEQPVAQPVVDLALRRCPAPPASRWRRRLASAMPSPFSQSLLIVGPSPVYASPAQPSGGCTVRMIGRS